MITSTTFWVALVTEPDKKDTWPTDDDKDFRLYLENVPDDTDVAEFKQLVKTEATPELSHVGAHTLKVFTKDAKKELDDLRAAMSAAKQDATQKDVSLYVLYALPTTPSKRGRGGEETIDEDATIAQELTSATATTATGTTTTAATGTAPQCHHTIQTLGDLRKEYNAALPADRTRIFNQVFVPGTEEDPKCKRCNKLIAEHPTQQQQEQQGAATTLSGGDESFFKKIKSCSVAAPKPDELTTVSLSGGYSWFTHYQNEFHVRSFYPQLYDGIMQLHKPKGGVILLGSPGIGKSLGCLNYLLVRLLQDPKYAKYNIVFDAPKRGLWYFKQGKVFPVNKRDEFFAKIVSDQNIIRLHDLCQPSEWKCHQDGNASHHGMRKIRGFTICASSPNPRNFKQAKKDFQDEADSGSIIYVPLWSEKELRFLNGLQPEARQLEPAELEKRVEWVRAPRYLFATAADFVAHISDVDSYKLDLVMWYAFQRACTGSEVPRGTISHKVLGMRSGKTLFECEVDFVGPAVKKCIMKSLANIGDAERKTLFNRLMSVDSADVLAGHMFEQFLHRHLPECIHDEGATTCLEKPSIPLPKLTGSHVLEEYEQLPANLDANKYYKPTSQNYACVDSFAVYQTGTTRHYVAFQHTVGKKHGIKAVPLLALLKALGFTNEKTDTMRFHLVFVVPAGYENAITGAQSFTGDQSASKWLEKCVVQHRRAVPYV